MQHPQNNIFDKANKITRRSFIVLFFKIFGFFLLISRAVYLQIFKAGNYLTLSDKNRINVEPITPLRGNILDAKGNLVAKNISSYRLIFYKTSQSRVLQVIDILAETLSLPEEIAVSIRNKIAKPPKNSRTVIIDELTWQQVIKIEENSHLLPELKIENLHIRYYPFGETFSHIVGFVGKISKKEKNQKAITYDNNLVIGRSGIEKFYDQKLRGNFGWQEIEVNAFGKKLRQISYKSSVVGDNLVLTIEPKLQNFIHDLYKGLSGTVIVSDYTNGNIVALVSAPSIDNNIFKKIDTRTWKNILNDQEKPIINRAIQSLYPPGSPFKIITTLAALEAGVPANKVFECTGGVFLGKQYFRCWHKAGHGEINMKDALIHSCNCYMYNLVKLIGYENIIKTARIFGIGSKTGIDLPFEVNGILPNDAFKKSRFRNSWNIGDSYNLCIGQGFLSTTPMQLNVMISAIANNGILHKPKLNMDSTSECVQIDIKPEFLNLVKSALDDVINNPKGTSYASRSNDYNSRFSGKTGTSQVIGKRGQDKDLSSELIARKHRNHALFVGFNQNSKHKYAVTILVEHGGGGAKAASPIAKKIFEFI
ncbi:MAG: penicillin-binding protein 2 [Rickettsiaceae bacterium]|nr:penicillin-binding protein 2 [Rickettsiaceae bacterium]